jgi:DNA polymerase alpha subunit B
VEALPRYSFFAGQIVALKGVNASGSYFAATEALELPLLPTAATTAEELRELAAQNGDRQLNVLTAAGPYTMADNLDFAPLDALVSQINDTKPDAVILVGPFLDCLHPLVRRGDIPAESDITTLDDFFKAHIVSKLAVISPETTVILIPHTRDVVAKHSAYPQKGFDRKALGLGKNFRCLPNPATFTLNGVVFSATSIEALQDIVRSSVTKRDDTTPSVFTLAFQHIISQRRIYPVFPGSATDSEATSANKAGVSLDVPYLSLGNINHAVPDVLIVPSAMKHQAQIVHNVVSVNPGQLAKQSSLGVYATICVNPQPIPDEDSTALVPHRVWERARVDIVKL